MSKKPNSGEGSAAVRKDGATPSVIAESDRFIAAVEREQMIADVNTQLRLFRREGSGLNLWRAYLLVREFGEPVPEVILLYFDRMARALQTAQDVKAVAAAVGMEGRGTGGSSHKHAQRVDRTLDIVSRVRLLRDLNRSEAEAFRQAGKQFGMKAGTVKKLYQRWCTQPVVRAPSAHAARSVFDWGQSFGE